MDTELREICHLWRCAAFGASPEDLRRSVRQGYEATVRELVHYDRAPSPPDDPPFCTVIPPGLTVGFLQLVALVNWWIARMVRTPRPLEEKLTLFWHGHFTTAADPVFSSGLLLRQNQLFRDNARGRFGQLLLAVARDPAMLVYLDGHQNKKSHPNENFAREVMELFTLGEGHYTEQDVREAARAFTGWTLQWPQATFKFDPGEHDDGPKRVLGHTGQLGGEDVLNILACHPQTARHICGRLFRFFTGVDAEPTTVNDLAEVYRKHHGHLLPVVYQLFLSPQFRRAAHARQGYKSPLEFVVSAYRALQTAFTIWNFNDWNILEALTDMGQVPFNPPSVQGWNDGQAWVNTATLLERLNFVSHLVDYVASRAGFEAWIEPLAGGHVDRRLLWAFGMPDASPGTRRVLRQAWQEDQGEDPAQAGTRLVELALASPDFCLR